MDQLGACIKFDHGYGRESAPAGYLLAVVAALDGADQRRFLRFVTGSPRLPPGGVAALHVRCCLASPTPLPLSSPCTHVPSHAGQGGAGEGCAGAV